MSSNEEERNKDVYVLPAPPRGGTVLFPENAEILAGALPNQFPRGTGALSGGCAYPQGKGAFIGDGGFTFGDYFHGMKPETTVTQNWNKNAPAWRIAVPGLNLEGICKNTACKAYQKSRTIIQWGRRDFDFFEDEHLSLCPLCKKYVQPITCGFTDTQWMAVGIRKMEAGKPSEKVPGVWERARSGVYTTFDDNPASYAQWKDLKIKIKPL